MQNLSSDFCDTKTRSMKSTKVQKPSAAWNHTCGLGYEPHAWTPTQLDRNEGEDPEVQFDVSVGIISNPAIQVDPKLSLHWQPILFTNGQSVR